jgi:hypothetical protein
MLNTTRYHPIAQLLFAPDNVVRLAALDAQTLFGTIAPAAGQTLVPFGSIVGNDNKLLKRAKLLGDVPSGATKIYVDNPWVFVPGDAIKIIAPLGSTPAAELASITGGGGAVIGTILSIDSSTIDQATDIVLGSAIVGNTVSVEIEGISASYAIASTTLATELNNIAAAINRAAANCEELRYVSAASSGTAIRITVGEPRYLIRLSGSIVQGTAASVATIATTMVRGLGAITLAAPTTAAIPNGTKIGTLTQTAVGIIENECDLTIYPNSVPVENALTPVIGGLIYLAALKYVDAQVVQSLNKCSFMPNY